MSSNLPGDVASYAVTMTPRSSDKYFPLTMSRRIMLSAQEENGGEVSWHVRAISMLDHTCLASFHCTHILFVLSAVANLEEKYGNSE